jgi:hypothetical protein
MESRVERPLDIGITALIDYEAKAASFWNDFGWQIKGMGKLCGHVWTGRVKISSVPACDQIGFMIFVPMV